MSDGIGAEIVITKPAAAKRLIESSILMRLRGDDALAVYAVAHATFGSLNDILGKRKREPFGDAFAASLFYLGEALAEGRKLTSEEQTLLAYPGLSDAARTVYSNAQEVGAKAADLRGNLPPQTIKDARRILSNPANFLKHADRDANGALSESTFDADRVITAAIGCYLDLMNEVSFSMQVFSMFLAPGDLVRRQQHPLHDIASKIEGRSETERARICLRLVAPDLEGIGE